MNKLRFYLFLLHFLSLSLVLQSQSVKSIVKNIKKTHVRLYGILDKDTFTSVQIISIKASPIQSTFMYYFI